MATEWRLRHHESEQYETGDRQPRDQRDISDRLDAHEPDRRRQILRRAAAGDRNHQAPNPNVGGERHDKGIHLEPHHQQAVEHADDPPDDQRQPKRNRNHQPLRRESNTEPDTARAKQDAGHHRGQRRDRFHGQVHVARDDNNGETDRHHANKGRLFDNVGEDADLEKIRDRNREHRQHDDQHEPDEVVEEELDKRPAIARESGTQLRRAAPGAGCSGGCLIVVHSLRLIPPE